MVVRYVSFQLRSVLHVSSTTQGIQRMKYFNQLHNSYHQILRHAEERISVSNTKVATSRERGLFRAFDNFSYVTRQNVVDITTTCNIEAGEQFFLNSEKTTLVFLNNCEIN